MRFLLQPFGTPTDTHFPVIQALLGAPELDAFLFASAFVRQSGVVQIEGALGKRQGAVTVVAGVNNGVTSLQGLQSLLGAGAKVFAFDTGSRSRIFHPKVFLGWGASKARLIIGSANLTRAGLGNNVEASLELNLDLSTAVGKATLDAVRSALTGAQVQFPEHCRPVLSLKELQALLDEGRLEDEDATPDAPEVPAGKPPKVSKPGSLKPIPLPWVPAKASKKTKAPTPPPSVTAAAATARGAVSRGPLVWQKANLKGTDAQQPPSPGTNPTGNLRLSVSNFKVGAKLIDKITYFRKNVFGGLVWAKSGTTESATASCNILKAGASLGAFDLKLSHDLKRIAGQNNVPTVLHWGDATGAVRKAKVQGLTLRLYGVGPDGRFTIEFA